MNRSLLVLAFCFLRFTSTDVFAQQFIPDCPLNQLGGQIRNLRQPHPVDGTCRIDGEGSPGSQAQNHAKNNFCAANAPVEVNVSTLRQLETATEFVLTQAHIPFGSPTSIPPNRVRLRQGFNLGNRTFKEGMTVLIRGFVLDAHYSNLRNGEKVNCTTKGKINNDIHVALGATPTSDHCFSITAEISPHFRPTTWADFDDYEFTHPVMFLGQLFYDASHRPCTPGHPVNPARISSWEIHPVYSIFVCRNATLQGCPANGNVWTPFDVWVTLPDDEDIGYRRKRRRDTLTTLDDVLYNPNAVHSVLEMLGV
jgi:hypothetical protein